MVFLESALSSKFNPLVTLGRSGSFGTLKGFVNRFNGDAELLDDLVLICSPLVSVPSWLLFAERSLDVQAPQGPYFHLTIIFSLPTLLGRAQPVDWTIPTIRVKPANPHFVFKWWRALCGGWCAQDFEKGQEIIGASTDIGSPIYAQRCVQCVLVLNSMCYVIMTPHVQVRLSTLRKSFAPRLPPCVFIYDDLSNSRPPNGVLTLVNSLSTKRHRTLHHADTDEEMVSQFVCGETRASLTLRLVSTLP